MIILANNKTYTPIAPYSRKELIQGHQRNVFEIHFKADETGVDGYTEEEIRELYKDTTPFEDIKFYEDLPDESGNYKFLSEHLNYTIPVNFETKTIDDIERHIIKIAQLSELEIMQKEQAEQIALLQDCILELSAK